MVIDFYHANSNKSVLKALVIGDADPWTQVCDSFENMLDKDENRRQAGHITHVALSHCHLWCNSLVSTINGRLVIATTHFTLIQIVGEI